MSFVAKKILKLRLKKGVKVKKSVRNNKHYFLLIYES